MENVFARVPPQDIAAEQSVLGAILLDNAALDTAMENLGLEDFYRESHREIYRAMCRVSERREPIDAITLAAELRSAGLLEAIGGSAYVAELASVVPTAANIAHYARIVRRASLLRQLASTATEIASGAFEHSVTDGVEDYVDDAERRIFAIAEQRQTAPFLTADEIARRALLKAESMIGQASALTGLSSGFIDLDRLTAGLQPSDLIVIAARPSMGKTALALNVAMHVATLPGNPGVAFFSLEMGADQLGLRLLCSEARVDVTTLPGAPPTGQLVERLATAASRITGTRLTLDDSGALTAAAIRAKCRRLARNPDANLKLIVVDYLQLLKHHVRVESREKEIAEISRALKLLAKELNIPVIALSQLNRQVESRADKRPTLADLRESGAIEQDADLIAFIYRDEVYNPATQTPSMAELIVAKHRNGPTGIVRLTFRKQLTRFENYAEPEDDAAW